MKAQVLSLKVLHPKYVLPSSHFSIASRANVGLLVQILVVGPKLVFSYTLAQTLIPLFGQYV